MQIYATTSNYENYEEEEFYDTITLAPNDHMKNFPFKKDHLRWIRQGFDGRNWNEILLLKRSNSLERL